MSIPTTKTPAQSSILSFFKSSTSEYAPAPPPSSAAARPHPSLTASQPESPLSLPPTPTPTPLTPPSPAVQANLPLQSTATTTKPPISIAPLPSSLPPRAGIRLVSKQDTNALRRINALLLPVSYPDTFYAFASDPLTGRYSRVITWTDKKDEPEKVIGGVVCRVEPVSSSGPAALYIRSLCLLSPYRGLGLANAALDNIVAAAVGSGVEVVTAHVWTENQDGLKWYEGRGFKKGVRPIDGYYLKLRPGSAWLMEREISSFKLESASADSIASTSLSKLEVSSPTAAVVNLPPMRSPQPTISGTRPPTRPGAGQSYQNQRAETEWNDLPVDMATGRLAPPKRNGSESGSGQSSRSSSAVRKKRDRAYPAAAFGKTD